MGTLLKNKIELILIRRSKKIRLKIKKLIKKKILTNNSLKSIKNDCYLIIYSIIRKTKTLVSIIVTAIYAAGTIFFYEPTVAVGYDYNLNSLNQSSAKEKVVMFYDRDSLSLEDYFKVNLDKNTHTIEKFGQSIPVSKKEKSILNKYKESPMSLNKLDKRDNYEKELYLKHQGRKTVTTYNIIQAESTATFLENLEVKENQTDAQFQARKGRKLKESAEEAKQRHLEEELKRQAGDTMPRLGDLDD